MGLDIYLYRYDKDPHEMRLVEDQYQRGYNKLWGGRSFNSMNKEERNEISQKCKVLASALGLSEWGNHPSKVKIELPSVKYPDHLYKIGYLRSSYNDEGLNNVLHRAGLHTLHEVFEPEAQEEFLPYWAPAHERATDLLQSWLNYCDSDEGKYDAFNVKAKSVNGSGPISEREALDLFLKEVATHERSQGLESYRSAKGDFFLKEAVHCFAFIPGKDCLGKACVYVIQKRVADEWYTHALEIMVEMCEWVLAQGHPGRYWLHWSG